MFRADTLRNIEQACIEVKVIYLAKGRKHGPKLKSNEAWTIATQCDIGVQRLLRSLSGQSVGLKDNRRTARLLNQIYFLLISNLIPPIIRGIVNERPGYKF